MDAANLWGAVLHRSEIFSPAVLKVTLVQKVDISINPGLGVYGGM